MAEGTWNRNVRFYKDREKDNYAWQILHSDIVKKYGSQNTFIIEAIVSYYERRAAIETDPYLETREKEDAFANRIVGVVGEKLAANIPAIVGLAVMQGGNPVVLENKKTLSRELLKQTSGADVSAKEQNYSNTIPNEPEENELLDYGFGM